MLLLVIAGPCPPCAVRPPQELAFRVNLGVFWVLGLPTACTLALKLHMGALGLWLAMAGASALQVGPLQGAAKRSQGSGHGQQPWLVVLGHAQLSVAPLNSLHAPGLRCTLRC